MSNLVSLSEYKARKAGRLLGSDLEKVLLKLEEQLDSLDPSIVSTVDEAFAEWERLQELKKINYLDQKNLVSLKPKK